MSESKYKLVNDVRLSRHGDDWKDADKAHVEFWYKLEATQKKLEAAEACIREIELKTQTMGDEYEPWEVLEAIESYRAGEGEK